MKITTVYTPSDTAGADVNFRSVYTLADLSKLAADLVTAGVQADDPLLFRVDPNGNLTVVREQTV